MAIKAWYVAVLAIVLALAGWRYWRSRRIVLGLTAAALLAISGLFGYNFAVEIEESHGSEMWVDAVQLVGVTAVAGVFLAAIAIAGPRAAGPTPRA
jgi:hypothetical protein